ncbi:carboxylesterase/lipase family protein [Pokkaliibacter sp. CJK22405]|uniref:carboxylesterase/lipase family protein n=1 Tax=Pokkaliibacter sp. CJK22405 TaxID=3384615 RepID=UPI0039855237
MKVIAQQTTLGTVQGHNNQGVNTYIGIPYAAAPVGELRFRAPQPFIATDELINKSPFKGAAMQPKRMGFTNSFMVNPDLFTEDCLYLNIFTPEQPDSEQPLPVMVWLHGGSAMFGSANQSIYAGEHLAREGIIVVTVNYRVGLFGYLELGSFTAGDYSGSGNNAMRDQLMALQWVHRHISEFGGDPARITLTGESSGAKSIAGLLALPEARVLLCGAILASGTGDCVHSLASAEEVTALFAGQLSMSQRKRLLTLDSASLIAAQEATAAQYSRQFPFRAVIDQMLLTDTPEKMLRRKDLSSLNILMGFNRDDGWFQLPPAALRPAGERNASRYAGRLTHFSAERSRPLLERALSLAPEKNLLQLVSDLEYIQPGLALLDTLSDSGARTYLYQFAIEQTEGPFAGFSVHASDVPYVWRNFDDDYMSVFARPDAASHESGQALMHTWVSFIKTGLPRSKLATLPRYRPIEKAALSFDNDGVADLGDELRQREAFWQRVLSY